MSTKDTILIRRPDGTFERVQVEGEQSSADPAIPPKTPETTTPKEIVQPASEESKTPTKAQDILSEQTTPIQPIEPAENQDEVSPYSKALEGVIVQSNDEPVTDPASTQEVPEKQPTQISEQPNKAPAAIPQDSTIDWDAHVQAVIESVSLELFDETAERRLYAIILSRLRDVRSFLQTKDTLIRDRESGGLGLSESDAADVLAVLDQEYKKVHIEEQQLTTPASPQHGHVEDVYRPQAELEALASVDVPTAMSDDYATLLSQHLTGSEVSESTEPEQQAAPVQETLAEKAPVQEEPVDILAGAGETESAAVSQEPAEPAMHEPEPIPEPPASAATSPITREIETETSPQPSMQDVKVKKRLVGPVDELKTMRLMDFRRLGNTTDDRLQKIMDKIATIEEESFSDKVKAIKGWRQSPLYRQYVAIGAQSLGSHKTVQEVIAETLDSGKETITVEEFEKISDFNKRLRY